MKIIPLALSAGALCVLLDPSAYACGFKAGGAMGAARYDQIARTSNPVNIVMYSNPRSEDAEKVLSPKLEVVLSKIGHAVKRVETREEFQKVLGAGRWDCETHGHHDVQVVLADLPDAEGVGSGGPAVVPIVAKPEEFDRAKRQKYPVVLTPSARPGSHVPAIENVARLVSRRSPGVMIAGAGHDASEDRTPTAVLEQREAIGGGSSARSPIAAGGAEVASRGGPVTAGHGEPAVAARGPSEAAARREPAAQNETFARDAAPVRVEPIARETAADAAAPRGARSDKREAQALASRAEVGSKKTTREELYFGSGSVKLAPGRALRALDRHVQWMQENTSGTVTLEGHADRSGPANINQTLSEQRADSAKAYLVAKGIAESRVRTVGYGEERPVDPPGDSPRNRCVVVVRDDN